MKLSSWLWDLLGLAGIACVAIGLTLIYPPLAWLGVGVLMIASAVLGAKEWGS